MDDLPFDANGILYRGSALDAGATDNQLARAVRRGELTRIWAGAFARTSAVAALRPDELHRLTTIAAATGTDGVTIPSHQSAAVLHGMSLLMPDFDRVHVSLTTPLGGRRERRRHVHTNRLDSDSVVVVNGIAVTSLEQTALDVARCAAGFAHALAAMDSALRLGADRERLLALLDEPRKGVELARRAMRYADPLSENAGESWGRAQMIVAGLPIPRLQHSFHDDHGTFVARTDYDWGGVLVGEFDGLAKYQKFLQPGETPFDVVAREKAREHALRKLELMVLRWLWEDLRRNRMIPMLRVWLGRCGLLPA